jgi:signal transduction histidine kinase
MTMRWRRLLLNAPPLRAMLEALLLAVTLWLPLLAFQFYRSPNLWQLAIDLLVGPLGLLYYVLRLRVPADFLKRQSLVDTTVALLLGLALSGIVLVLVPGLLQSALSKSLWRGLDRALVLAVFSLMGNCALFVIARIALRIWLFWDGLRRRQLLWALTHAHVMVLALGAALLILLLDLLILAISCSFLLLVPTTLGLVVLSIVMLAAIIPLSALVSYLVVGRITNRLKSLAAATGLLRGGNYAVRIPVVGEDEVAKLQSDFNAMAADLERVMRQLQGERDTVAGLLQSRRELIVSVSHELRTPMATLRGYLETTLNHWEEIPPTTLQRDLQVMEDEVIRLQALVEDLFTLSRAEVGRLTLRCEPADVGMLVKRIVETRAPLAWRASRIEVVADVPCDVPPALVDASRLEQVLQNLLHNALRHTPPGGIVAVALVAGADSIALQVKDTGEGIAPVDLPRIWERFYQAKNEHTSTSSAGLGLSLVKELIEGMGGSVAVDSIIGEGSCFTIRLPRACIDNASSAAANTAPAHLELLDSQP